MPGEFPWQVNRPIVQVKKELYQAPPRQAAVTSMQYVGPGLERLETRAVEATVDIHSQMVRRFSNDNGRTWSAFEPVPSWVALYGGHEFVEVGSTRFFDPVTGGGGGGGVLVEAWLRQVGVNLRPDAEAIRNSPAGIQTRQVSVYQQYHAFAYTRVSRDHGRTWSVPQQLRYETGEAFDPREPFKPAFLQRNQAYFGNNFIRHSNGTLLHAVCAANSPTDADNEKRYCRLGALCFAGRWNPAAGDYAWTAGRRIEVPIEFSSEGLQEPSIAELRDGRVLIVWRATATPQTPGRKWFTLSSDGGMTLGPLTELRYDDGSSFHSPSSIHHLFRHSVTGRLYWLGNISRVATKGNWPRYPLVIAEVDEEKIALKRATVTAIDDINPAAGQSEYVEFSNFWHLENRETHEVEIYLTAYGEDPEHVNNANCYRYTLTF